MQVPIDSLDLSLVSILYTQGDQAAIVPNYNYNFQILHDTITISSWRQLLYWLGPPGAADSMGFCECKPESNAVVGSRPFCWPAVTVSS